MRSKKRNYYYLKKKKEAMKKLIIAASLFVVILSIIALAVFMHWNPLGGVSLSWITSVVKNDAPQVIDKGGEFIKDELSKSGESKEQVSEGKIVFRIGVMSDTHGATANIKKALMQMQLNKVDLVVHLGDFTAGGELDQIKDAYNELESSGISYRVIPGDHDFNWVPEHSYSNFEKYFGEVGSSIVDDKNAIVVMYANASDTNEESITWLKTTLSKYSDTSKPILFFGAKPLYSPYFKAKEDAGGTGIIGLLVDADVAYAFAGDTHVFARYKDLSGKLDMVTVGALGKYKNPLPQWVLVNIYDTGRIEVKPEPLVDF